MKKAWILKLLGIALFIYILSRLDLAEVYSIFRQSRWWLLIALTGILAFLTMAVRAYKWVVLLSGQGIRLGIADSFRIISVTAYVSIFVPGRLGDLARVYYLRKKGHSVARSAVSVFVDRVQDIAVLVLFGCAGIFYFSSILLEQTVIAAVCFSALVAAACIVAFSKRIRERLSRWIVTLLPGKYQEFIRRHLDRFLDDFSKLSLGRLLCTSLISLVVWLMTLCTIYICAQMLGISSGLIFTFMVTAIATLIAIIPVSFSGLGTRDAVIILAFAQVGLAAEQAVAFSAVFLLIYLEFALIGFLTWLAHPIELVKP